MSILLRCLLLSTLFALIVPTHAEVEEEYWARLLFDQKPVGHLHSKTEALHLAGEPVFKTTLQMALTFSRAGTILEVSFDSSTLEAADGTVLNYSQKMRVGPQILASSGTVHQGQIRVTSETGEQTFPYPNGAIGPRAFERTVRRPGLQPGASGQALLFDTENPAEAQPLTWEVLGPETKTALGTAYETVAVGLRYARLPGTTIRIWTEPDGGFIAGQIPLGGLGVIEMVRAPREVALGHVQPAEIFSTSLITPNRPIGDPAQLTQATFRLITPTDVNLTLPESPGQSILNQAPGQIDVRITLPQPPPPETIWQRPVPPSDSLAPFLESSRFIDWQTPAVQALTTEIIGHETNALAVARLIQTGIYQKIRNKNLATGFARASEVAQTLSGDCTEHAVLAAAIARAAGLPARVVSGLVHAPDPSGRSPSGIFGFHMWTEIMIAPDTWWPIDPSFNRFDPTHIAFTHSALQGMNPELELAIPILDAIGRIQLEILPDPTP